MHETNTRKTILSFLSSFYSKNFKLNKQKKLNYQSFLYSYLYHFNFDVGFNMFNFSFSINSLISHTDDSSR